MGRARSKIIKSGQGCLACKRKESTLYLNLVDNKMSVIREALQSLVRSVVGSRRLCSEAVTHQHQLPWSVLQPFGSIRVNLTEAFASGWRGIGDFPAQLQGKADIRLGVVIRGSVCDRPHRGVEG